MFIFKFSLLFIPDSFPEEAQFLFCFCYRIFKLTAWRQNIQVFKWMLLNVIHRNNIHTTGGASQRPPVGEACLVEK